MTTKVQPKKRLLELPRHRVETGRSSPIHQRSFEQELPTALSQSRHGAVKDRRDVLASVGEKGTSREILG
jgi:hypothetical protein